MTVNLRVATRTEIGLPDIVVTSGGTPRPPINFGDGVTVHYPGIGYDIKHRPGVDHVHRTQAWAVSQNKPFEYNYQISQADTEPIYEVAGTYRAAHSAGENGSWIGVQFMNGNGEPFTAGQILKFRWLLARLREVGVLREGHEIRPHRHMPGANTACPGDLGMAAMPALIEPYERPPMPPTEPLTVDLVDLTGPLAVVHDPVLRGDFALVEGRWVCWPVELAALFPDTPTTTIDHQWLREQILDDQGPDATDLWRTRANE